MDTVDPLRVLFSFLFILALIGLMAALMKRYGQMLQSGAAPVWLRKIIPQQGVAGFAPEARLRILEVRYIDPRHKLVLVRRDAAEHLLLIGPERDTVIESHIAHAEKTA